jgi:hypothetical protein
LQNDCSPKTSTNPPSKRLKDFSNKKPLILIDLLQQWSKQNVSINWVMIYFGHVKKCFLRKIPAKISAFFGPPPPPPGWDINSLSDLFPIVTSKTKFSDKR